VVLMFDQPVSSMPMVQAGKLKVLGITSAQRFPDAAGYRDRGGAGPAGFEAISWSGVCAPAGTPAGHRRPDPGRGRRVLKVPEIRDRLLRDGIEPSAARRRSFSRTPGARRRSGAGSARS
jgi:tripartite-type tricarboxylate transporter receptor subunit TctC